LKSIPAKLWLILGAIVAVFFFLNDFELVDIQKTAIILAAGIDRKEDDSYTLTAQIAVPKGVDRTTGGTSSVNFIAEGKTIADCVSDIYCKTGWVPKFVFCNLIVLGEETAKNNVFDALDFFLRNEYMSDGCYVAVSEGSAEDLLTSKSAIADTTSQAIAKLFSDANTKSGKAMKMSLREFAIGYHGVTKSGYMPYIRQHKQEGESSGGSGGSSGGSGSGSGGEQEEKIYCAERTALFYEGKQVALLEPDETFAFSLLEGKIFNGYLLSEENGKPVTLTVLEDDSGVSLDTKGAPKVTVKVNLTVRLFNRAIPAEMEDVARNEVSDELKENARKTVEERAQKVFEISRQSGCDLFNLNRALYRSSAKKYDEWKDTLLAAVPVTYEITIDTAK
ncbi:MAG: Ger(x)C family spore germination C-terminal domain-containing protein, partial [Clostridia bacterium]|nr:Ger(x)C family spore germination C-terminal domain-containing protein [Clostridia bacterium]